MTGAAGPLVCPVCDTPTVSGARFCHACGALLETSGVTDETAERRIVTVLFGDLSDFTAWAEDLDPERVGVVTDRVLAALSRAATETGGRVDKLTGDGIMVVFGAPVAHEDDAERAVRAASRMQADVRRMMAEETGGGRRMGLRVGLNTGEVLAGVQAHLTYTVVGDTVNTASRLSDAAGIGEVLAGRETALATMAIASWRALPPLRLKGKREPVAAYELVGIRPPGAARLGLGDEAPFIGRDAEFGRLVGKLLDVAEGGRPASVVVTGDAGVGKTRLGLELARFATEVPATRVLWGRCTPYGEGRDLAPLAEWMRTAFGIGEGDDPETAEVKARRTMSRLVQQPLDRPLPAAHADRLLALLGLVEPRTVGPRDAAAPGTSGVPRDPFVEAVCAVLDALAADGPLVLIVDDAQWAPPGLVAELSRLVRDVTGAVLLVAIGRSDVLGQDWWDRMPELEGLPVTPLDEPASERLLRAYLGGAELDLPTREMLVARAQGNPFFLAELLHLLVDRGLLRRIADGWHLDGELPRDILPAGVQAVLAARIDGLDPAAKATLRDAAVVGTRFTVAALQALAPQTEPAEVEASIRELVARGIVRPGDGEESRTFLFAHTLARDVAYAGIPKAERARRHARVASWARGDDAWPAGDVDALIATQAERAIELATEMDLPRDDLAWSARTPGFAALARLGEASLARDDNTRAERLLDRALRIAPQTTPPTALADAAIGQAAALVGLHRLGEAEERLGEAMRSDDARRRAAALVVLGDIRRRRGDLAEAARALVSALAAASDTGVDRVAGEALRQLGMIDYRTGRLAAAEGRFGDALALAERVGDRRGAGWALQHLAWSATTRGDYDRAEQMLRRAAEVFTALNDDGGLSWCAGTEAFVRLLQGRLHEARDLASGLLPLGRAMGARWGSAACLTIIAFAAAEMGDVDAALEETDTAYDEFSRLSDSWGQSMALAARGAALRAAGRHDDAIDTLRQAVELSRSALHPATGALASALLGYSYLDIGDAAAAQAAAESALAIVTGMDLEPGALVGLRVLLAQALRAAGRLDEALPMLADAERCSQGSLLFPRRQAMSHYAGALLEAEQVGDAVRVVHAAFTVPAEDVRSRVIALRVLAQALNAGGDTRAADLALRQARALATSTEMTSETKATEAALTALTANS